MHTSTHACIHVCMYAYIYIYIHNRYMHFYTPTDCVYSPRSVALKTPLVGAASAGSIGPLDVESAPAALGERDEPPEIRNHNVCMHNRRF